MPSEILLYIVLGISTISIVWIAFLHNRISKFFKRGDKDIEEFLNAILNQLDYLTEKDKGTEALLKDVMFRNKKSVRGVEAMRYNPFKDQGGNQSFSVAMVDEEGNGVIFSSLYSRERNSFFLKPVKDGSSEHELTGEEKVVLKKALEKTK